MHLTWYGTAGFCLETGGWTFLIDPYLSRPRLARPALKIDLADVVRGDEVYLSHGHFDHAADVPQVARQTGTVVYCSQEVAEALYRRGMDSAQIVVAHGGDVFDFGTYRAECFPSAHVRFDLPLVAATLWRALLGLPSLVPMLWGLRGWPRGQVLTWRFTLAAEGDRVVQHLGSAGCTEDELACLEEKEAPDVLMVPLQGHTQVCRIAAHIVGRLKPRLVIPHHHDDFCPPISQMVDIAPFVEAVSAISPLTRVVELPVGERVEI